MPDTVKRNYENAPVCAACGGDCCKACPGSAYPEDFEPDVMAGVWAALESGSWAIDWWEGDPREGKHELPQGYFVCPAVQGCRKVFDPSWGGPCVFLEKQGCSLPPDEHPHGCRMLEPLAGGHCRIHDSPEPKRDAALAWLSYQEQLEEVGRQVTEEFKEKGVCRHA